jgi:nucleotide-binding universal stress UspA family protein
VFCAVSAPTGEATPALAQALALAKVSDAHISIVVTARELTVPFSLYSGVLDSTVGPENARLKKAAEEAAAAANDACALAGLSHDVQVLCAPTVEIADQVAHGARLHDLVVLDRPDEAIDGRELLLETALFSSGRPVLVVPPRSVAIERFSRVVVAWDGSVQAARALGDVLCFLPSARTIDIVSVAGEKDLARSVPGTDIARHIVRHGREVNVVDLTLQPGGVAVTIDTYARESGAQLIAMGGYGHSRLRQFVLGGATRGMIHNATLPVLMSH